MILVALGANLPSKCGPPAATLDAALGRLEALGLHIVSVSSFYKTPAWPNPADPPFVNVAPGGNGSGGYDATVANPVGRLFSFYARKRF